MFVSGIGALRVTRVASLSSLLHVKTQVTVSSVFPGEASPEPHHACTLILDRQPPQP